MGDVLVGMASGIERVCEELAGTGPVPGKIRNAAPTRSPPTSNPKIEPVKAPMRRTGLSKLMVKVPFEEHVFG
jgi:hypothetical protein